MGIEKVMIRKLALRHKLGHVIIDILIPRHNISKALELDQGIDKDYRKKNDPFFVFLSHNAEFCRAIFNIYYYQRERYINQ